MNKFGVDDGLSEALRGQIRRLLREEYPQMASVRIATQRIFKWFQYNGSFEERMGQWSWLMEQLFKQLPIKGTQREMRIFKVCDLLAHGLSLLYASELPLVSGGIGAMAAAEADLTKRAQRRGT